MAFEKLIKHKYKEIEKKRKAGKDGQDIKYNEYEKELL